MKASLDLQHAPLVQRRESAMASPYQKKWMPPDHGTAPIVQRKLGRPSSSGERPIQGMFEPGGPAEMQPLLQPPARPGLWSRFKTGAGNLYNAAARRVRPVFGSLLGARTMVSSAGGMIKDMANLGVHTAGINTAKGISETVGHVLTPAVGGALGGVAAVMNSYGAAKSGLLHHRLNQIHANTYDQGSANQELLDVAREESASNTIQNLIGTGLAGAGIAGGALSTNPATAAIGLGSLALSGLGTLGLLGWKGVRRARRAGAQSQQNNRSAIRNFFSPGLPSMTAIKRAELGEDNLDPALTALIDHHNNASFIWKDRPGIPGGPLLAPQGNIQDQNGGGEDGNHVVIHIPDVPRPSSNPDLPISGERPPQPRGRSLSLGDEASQLPILPPVDQLVNPQAEEAGPFLPQNPIPRSNSFSHVPNRVAPLPQPRGRSLSLGGEASQLPILPPVDQLVNPQAEEVAPILPSNPISIPRSNSFSHVPNIVAPFPQPRGRSLSLGDEASQAPILPPVNPIPNLQAEEVAPILPPLNPVPNLQAEEVAPILPPNPIPRSHSFSHLPQPTPIDQRPRSRSLTTSTDDVGPL
ncbi:MAG: hypothetical protein AAF587_02465 [Bacteroidota bacterium]